MKFHISAVILWPKDSKFLPQIIPFEPGQVNVITGNARTGKSAIIPIIDYCLCASSCAIPKKVVMAECEWFGIKIETSEGSKLLARRNPGELDSVDDMFLLENTEIEIPEIITSKNSSCRKVKRQLDKLARLSHLDFGGGDVTNPTDYRIGFRDLMAFVFQPQNVVANRDILFYRSQKIEYKVKLAKNTLPYVLGIVTPENLIAQHEFERLTRILKRKNKELKEIQKGSAKWEAQMEGQLAQAEELGLVESSLEVGRSSEELLKLLRGIAKKTVEDFHVDSATITEAVERQIDLEAQDEKLSSQLAELKSRQEELSRLRDGVGAYGEALHIQQDRLAVSKWLFEQPEEETGCPICGESSSGTREKLEVLQKNLIKIESDFPHVEAMPVAVDREVQQIRNAIDEVAEQIKNLRSEKKGLTSNSKEAQKRQYHALSVAHFLGQLGAAVDLYDEVQSDGDLASEIADLVENIKLVRRELAPNEIKKRRDSALSRLSSHMARFMPKLDNDHGTNAAQLDIENLTLTIDGAEGQSKLWNIGSGSNHLSYHLATLLSLHTYFLESSDSVVPSFTVFDQPSQVYFPEKIEQDSEDEVRSWDSDEDVEAVRKIFTLLDKVVSDADGCLQVIVLDHAPPSVWGTLTHVHLAADWHSGDKLVPVEWITDTEA